MAATITIKKFLEQAAKHPGRFKAIIKYDVAGREIWLGCERSSKKSTKYREKFLFSAPIFADQLPHRREAARAAAALATGTHGVSSVGDGAGTDPASPDALAGGQAVADAGDRGRDGVPPTVEIEVYAPGQWKGGASGPPVARAVFGGPEQAGGTPERKPDATGGSHATD